MWVRGPTKRSKVANVAEGKYDDSHLPFSDLPDRQRGRRRCCLSTRNLTGSALTVARTHQVLAQIDAQAPQLHSIRKAGVGTISAWTGLQIHKVHKGLHFCLCTCAGWCWVWVYERWGGKD